MAKEGGLRRTYKSLKRGVITGAVIGALVGSTYQNIDHAYSTVLKSLMAEAKLKSKVIESVKKDLPKGIYKSRKEEYQKIENEIKERSSEYKKSSDSEKKKIALGDFKNLRKTIKEIDILPKSPSDIVPIGKSAGYGGVAGGAGGLGFAFKRRKRRKEKMRKRLEEENQTEEEEGNQ